MNWEIFYQSKNILWYNVFVKFSQPDIFVVFLQQKLSEVFHAVRDEVTGLLPEPDVVTGLMFVLILVSVALLILAMILITVTLERREGGNPFLDSHRRPAECAESGVV